MSRAVNFFSYSRADSKFVLRLATDLKNKNLNVWLDQLDIEPGARWDSSVEIALSESECILVILSQTSVKSENVLDEISYAIKKGKRVIPLLFQECDIPFRIARFQLIDFTTDYNIGLQVLSRALNLNADNPNKTEGDEPQQLNLTNNIKPSIRKPFLKFGILFIVLGLAIGTWFVWNRNSRLDREIAKNEIYADSVSKSKNNSVAKNFGEDTAGSILRPGKDISEKNNNAVNLKRLKDSIFDEVNKINLSKKDTTKKNIAVANQTKVVKDSSATQNSRPANKSKLDEDEITLRPDNNSKIFTVLQSIVHNDSYRIWFKRDANEVWFYMYSVGSSVGQYPSVNVDVNQNSMIDENLDRGYGIKPSTQEICPYFLIRKGVSSVCGGAPSNAQLSHKGNQYIFKIPLIEIMNKKPTIAVQFTYATDKSYKAFFPSRLDNDDFKSVYTIDVTKIANNND